MNQRLAVAVDRLIEVLDGENEALKVMDLRRAATLLPQKTVAIADLAAFVQSPSTVPSPALAPAARRLNGLVQENRRLLERAMAAQQRVVGIVVRAVTSAQAEPCYRTMGRRVRPAGPVALSTRA